MGRSATGVSLPSVRQNVIAPPRNLRCAEPVRFYDEILFFAEQMLAVNLPRHFLVKVMKVTDMRLGKSL